MEHKDLEITLEAAVEEVADVRARRWASRESNPTMQMSIRMKTDVYDRFRAYCVMEGRTNGDQLEIMMRSHEEFLKRQTSRKARQAHPPSA